MVDDQAKLPAAGENVDRSRSRLRDCLEGIGLGAYLEGILADGFEDPEDLWELEEGDTKELADEVGMKRGHKAKLMRWVRGNRERVQAQAAAAARQSLAAVSPLPPATSASPVAAASTSAPVEAAVADAAAGVLPFPRHQQQEPWTPPSPTGDDDWPIEEGAVPIASGVLVDPLVSPGFPPPLFGVQSPARKGSFDGDPDMPGRIRRLPSLGRISMNRLPPSYHMAKEDFIMEEVLGKGAFGEVWKMRYKGHVSVAVKQFLFNSKDVESEIMCLARIQETPHPHVLTFLGAVFETEDKHKEKQVALVTKYMSGGSLYDLVVNRRSRTFDREGTVRHNRRLLVSLASQAASGVAHLHECGIIHRDLACRNLLLDGATVAVADFGFARQRAKTDLGAFSVSKNGPVCWEAPEALEHKNYCEATDAFMLGVTLWELVAHQAPWGWLRHVGEVWNAVKTGNRLPLPLSCDPLLGDLIIRCWSHDPRERPPIRSPSHYKLGVRDALEQRNHSLLAVERDAEAEVAAVADAVTGMLLHKVTLEKVAASVPGEASSSSLDGFGAGESGGGSSSKAASSAAGVSAMTLVVRLDARKVHVSADLRRLKWAKEGRPTFDVGTSKTRAVVLSSGAVPNFNRTPPQSEPPSPRITAVDGVAGLVAGGGAGGSSGSGSSTERFYPPFFAAAATSTAATALVRSSKADTKKHQQQQEKSDVAAVDAQEKAQTAHLTVEDQMRLAHPGASKIGSLRSAAKLSRATSDEESLQTLPGLAGLSPLLIQQPQSSSVAAIVGGVDISATTAPPPLVDHAAGAASVLVGGTFDCGGVTSSTTKSFGKAVALWSVAEVVPGAGLPIHNVSVSPAPGNEEPWADLGSSSSRRLVALNQRAFTLVPVDGSIKSTSFVCPSVAARDAWVRVLRFLVVRLNPHRHQKLRTAPQSIAATAAAAALVSGDEVAATATAAVAATSATADDGTYGGANEFIDFFAPPPVLPPSPLGRLGSFKASGGDSTGASSLLGSNKDSARTAKPLNTELGSCPLPSLGTPCHRYDRPHPFFVGASSSPPLPPHLHSAPNFGEPGFREYLAVRWRSVAAMQRGAFFLKLPNNHRGKTHERFMQLSGDLAELSWEGETSKSGLSLKRRKEIKSVRLTEVVELRRFITAAGPQHRQYVQSSRHLVQEHRQEQQASSKEAKQQVISRGYLSRPERLQGGQQQKLGHTKQEDLEREKKQTLLSSSPTSPRGTSDISTASSITAGGGGGGGGGVGGGGHSRRPSLASSVGSGSFASDEEDSDGSDESDSDLESLSAVSGGNGSDVGGDDSFSRQHRPRSITPPDPPSGSPPAGHSLRGLPADEKRLPTSQASVAGAGSGGRWQADKWVHSSSGGSSFKSFDSLFRVGAPSRDHSPTPTPPSRVQHQQTSLQTSAVTKGPTSKRRVSFGGTRAMSQAFSSFRKNITPPPSRPKKDKKSSNGSSGTALKQPLPKVQVQQQQPNTAEAIAALTAESFDSDDYQEGQQVRLKNSTIGENSDEEENEGLNQSMAKPRRKSFGAFGLGNGSRSRRSHNDTGDHAASSSSSFSQSTTSGSGLHAGVNALRMRVGHVGLSTQHNSLSGGGVPEGEELAILLLDKSGNTLLHLVAPNARAFDLWSFGLDTVIRHWRTKDFMTPTRAQAAAAAAANAAAVKAQEEKFRAQAEARDQVEARAAAAAAAAANSNGTALKVAPVPLSTLPPPDSGKVAMSLSFEATSLNRADLTPPEVPQLRSETSPPSSPRTPQLGGSGTGGWDLLGSIREESRFEEVSTPRVVHSKGAEKSAVAAVEHEDAVKQMRSSQNQRSQQPQQPSLEPPRRVGRVQAVWGALEKWGNTSDGEAPSHLHAPRSSPPPYAPSQQQQQARMPPSLSPLLPPRTPDGMSSMAGAAAGEKDHSTSNAKPRYEDFAGSNSFFGSSTTSNTIIENSSGSNSWTFSSSGRGGGNHQGGVMLAVGANEDAGSSGSTWHNSSSVSSFTGSLGGGLGSSLSGSLGGLGSGNFADPSVLQPASQAESLTRPKRGESMG